jgi:hypothetical protein
LFLSQAQERRRLAQENIDGASKVEEEATTLNDAS